MFRNFEERGERFRQLARAIAGAEGAPRGDTPTGPPLPGA
jgi:hypothetical protein